MEISPEWRNPLDWLLGLFSLDIGIDLGTANTLVHVKGRGVIIDEPSVVAIDKSSKRRSSVKAIGQEAKEMVGRTPSHIVAVRPLQDGVISDFKMTEEMIHAFIGKVHGNRAFGTARPRVVIGIPSGVTEVEKRAVRDATVSAGAREAGLVEEADGGCNWRGAAGYGVRWLDDCRHRRWNHRSGGDFHGRNRRFHVRSGLPVTR